MHYTQLLQFLRREEYREVESIHAPGEFIVLGDIVVFWPTSETKPYRAHYWGEDLERTEIREGEGWRLETQFPQLTPNRLQTEYGPVVPGDYIVHPLHGVGIFEGLVTQVTVDKEEKQFVALRYAGNDRLLVPMERQDGLMPYIGSRNPRLTRLYSKSWQRTTERVKEDLIHVARELLRIYAARQVHARPPYREAEEWLAHLDKTAGFSLTADQQRALQDIKGDLEKNRQPMDRLLCGDVGFGKTEVAIRAAAQVMAAGKQVLFLAPTTILVEQHYALLTERFATLPVTVEHISRLTAGKEKEILARLADGKADIVVGTHRLLGGDIQLPNLGLLIIDEEQKFGVTQKEKLKKLRPHVDVLSLSATPIPRTLSMSLSGLRGLSLLRTAPHGRLPIQTTIGDYRDSVLIDALLNELARGGQSYVIHNRVQSLPVVQRRIQQQLAENGFPDTRIAMAHGQMGEVELARTMAAFLKGEVDVLLASSIVGNGLDSARANTMVVLHSEWFGLSDLYQLRGRVGRRSTQAYAHFFTGGIEKNAYRTAEGSETPVPKGKVQQRLAALLEADTLGSGWSIAIRDLEIRGGGNILGNEQHGNMEAIGILLYGQLLQEEIGRQARELNITLFSSSEERDPTGG